MMSIPISGEILLRSLLKLLIDLKSKRVILRTNSDFSSILSSAFTSSLIYIESENIVENEFSILNQGKVTRDIWDAKREASERAGRILRAERADKEQEIKEQKLKEEKEEQNSEE